MVTGWGERKKVSAQPPITYCSIMTDSMRGIAKAVCRFSLLVQRSKSAVLDFIVLSGSKVPR